MRKVPIVASSTIQVRKKKGAAIGPFQPEKKQTLPGTFPEVKPPLVASHRVVSRKMGTGDNLSRQVVKTEKGRTQVVKGNTGVYNRVSMPIPGPIDTMPIGKDPVTLHAIYPVPMIARRTD